MKFPNGNIYVEVKDKRYTVHPTENMKLRETKPPKNLRSHNQVQNESKRGRNQKNNNNQNDQLEIKRNSKKKEPIFEKLQINLLFVLVVYRINEVNWIEVIIVKNGNLIVTNENNKKRWIFLDRTTLCK